MSSIECTNIIDNLKITKQNIIGIPFQLSIDTKVTCGILIIPHVTF